MILLISTRPTVINLTLIIDSVIHQELMMTEFLKIDLTHKQTPQNYEM